MLISTIAELRTASSINISNTIENWLPYISDAEEMFIIPSLGKEIYDAVNVTVNPKGPDVEPIGAPGDSIIPIDTLTAKVKKALALYALFLGIDELSVSLSSAGVQVLQSDTHKPAPQYQIMNLKETYLTRAHRQIDSILKFVSEYASQLGFSIPNFPYLIRNADEFQLYADIHASRRVFLSLLPVIGSIENKYIMPTLSPLQFQSLKANVLSGADLSTDDQALLDLVLPALVHLTMARALIEISIDTLDWGIFNSASNTFNNIQSKSQANKERISAMHDANQRDGEAELKMLQEFLDNNASTTKYALYFASSRYAGKENAVKRADFPNTSTNSIFVV